jgi:hypothetical protein
MSGECNAAYEWDDWITLHATRNEVAANYALALIAHGTGWEHWADVNAAILRRWTPSGLRYIKERAWKIATQNL